ncbi:Nucleoporin nup84 [Coniothyrium glycines]
MASFSFARQSQPTATQSNRSNAPLFSASRPTNGISANDPLQPLRAMAERVGKEVEKFAERVDHWHTQSNESTKAKHQATVKMVDRFRDFAESQVKELKRVNDADNKGDLSKSIRRRVRNLTEDHDNNNSASLFGQSSQSVIPSIESSAGHEAENIKDLRDWQAELATWELLRLVIEQYHHEPGTDSAASKKAQLQEVGGIARYCKNNEIWERFLLEDDQAKEKAIVLRWLEQTAQRGESEIGTITQELEQASGKGAHTWTNGWLHTKSKIKQVKRLEGTDQPLKATVNLKSEDRTTNLVTQLDPDVVARQNRALDKSDDYYERALWMVCYEMMRRGVPWKQIVDYCYERNEAWRAVSLGAANETNVDGMPNVTGPTVGYLFRRMCFHAARGARNSYEGAVYGLLSGDLKQVQAVSRSWDDHLYAHYNALLLSRFDTYLQQKYPSRVPESLTQKFVFQDAVANLDSWEESPQQVIALLRQQKATADQSVAPIKLIQGALIGRDVNDLMLKVGVALAEKLQHDSRTQNLIIHPDSPETDRNAHPESEHRTFTAERWYQNLASDPHAFRVLVHIFIIFQNGIKIIESQQNEQRWLAMDNVIAAYIEFLRISKRIQLIPLYAAQLLPERAAHCLARILPDIRNSEEQRGCVALLNSYRIDIIEVVAQSFTFAFKHSGFTHFDDEGYTVITNPIKRFNIIEKVISAQEHILWPGVRIKRELDGSSTEPKEEAVIDALQWYQYVSKDYEQTFEHLKNALTIFLLNGRLDAASRVIEDLSVESLSLSRTEALCGYPFDIMAPGTEEQDERQLHDHRDHLSVQERASAIPLAKLPDADRHREIVEDLRQKATPYYELQQIVRIIVFFREWRSEEDKLIKIRNDRAKDPNAPKVKPDTQRTKELLDAIESIFATLITSISESAHAGVIDTTDSWNLKKAYIPDIVLAYLSVLQTASYFLQRESANKAMEIAVLVADTNQAWLQKIFLQTGRMSELVDCLANVSKAMLRLTEHETKKVEKKKRGSKGETLRIWDVGVRDR